MHNAGSSEQILDPLGLIVPDLLAQYPEAAPVFLKYRMSCLGCEMSAFETLGDALRIYHLPVQPFLNELDDAINQPHPPD